MAINWKHTHNVNSWDVYENGTKIARYYSLKKAIHIAQIIGANLFGLRHLEVVDTQTGEIIYSIN